LAEKIKRALRSWQASRSQKTKIAVIGVMVMMMGILLGRDAARIGDDRVVLMIIRLGNGDAPLMDGGKEALIEQRDKAQECPKKMPALAPSLPKHEVDGDKFPSGCQIKWLRPTMLQCASPHGTIDPMRRLFLGLLACAFLSFVGVQASHHHDESTTRSCGICVLAGQTARIAPTTSPAVSTSISWQFVETPKSLSSVSAFLYRASARAPPAA
jgi:hypothetical protein